jgi:lipopolysaccharide export system protein LptA
MRTCFAFLAVLGAACFLLARSLGQSAPSESAALTGVSTNNETRILSDAGLEAHYQEKTYIYRKNVRVYNPQMNLTCEMLTIDAPVFEDGKFNRAVAETNVVIDWIDKNGTNHATADKAVYTYVMTNLAELPEQKYQTNQTVVLTGKPFVLMGGDTIRGDPIVWDRIKNVFYTTNLQETVLTNKATMFDTGVTPKTNSPPKTNSLSK